MLAVFVSLMYMYVPWKKNLPLVCHVLCMLCWYRVFASSVYVCVLEEIIYRVPVPGRISVYCARYVGCLRPLIYVRGAVCVLYKAASTMLLSTVSKLVT